jgi:hypothetical protein
MMPFAKLPLLRTPCHAHFLGAVVIAFLNLMIVFVFLGVWALQLIVLMVVGAGWAIYGLVRLGRDVAPRDTPPAEVWRGHDRSLLDDDPPTAPTPVQRDPEDRARRLGFIVGRALGRTPR